MFLFLFSVRNLEYILLLDDGLLNTIIISSLEMVVLTTHYFATISDGVYRVIRYSRNVSIKSKSITIENKKIELKKEKGVNDVLENIEFYIKQLFIKIRI